jgi:signal transduction histidine kinase
MLRKRFILIYFFITVLCQSLWSQSQVQNLYIESNQKFVSGNYAEALNCNIKALKIVEEGKDCGLHAYAYLQVGTMYYFLQDKKTALQYFYKSLHFADSCKVDSVIHKALHNIGAVYTELGKKDSALFYLSKAERLLETTSDYSNLAKINAVLAQLYLGDSLNYNKAKYYIDKAEKNAEKTSDKNWKAFVQIKYAIYYKNTNNLPSAIDHAKSALDLYEKAGSSEGRMYALHVLTIILIANRDTSANSYYRKLFLLKDSVFKTETANKIANYKTLYETEKKQKENDLLQEKNKVSQLEIESKNKAIIGLLFSILLSVLFVFWRISVINLKKKQKELEAQQKLEFERERISRDLHDNVGAQLSYLITNIDWMLEHPDSINTNDSVKRLDSLKDAGKQAILTLRQTIWALNNKQLSIEEFSDKLKQYALKMIEFDKTIQLRFTEHIDMNSNLSPGVALNLFRVCQEAFNNSLVHSKCKLIEMSFESNETSLLIFEISDDGIGFDLDNAERKGHYGLQNMKFRAKESGAELHFQSLINTGTKIRLVVTR